MRMWMVDPKKLCRKHLLGEHVECHMFAGTLIKNISIDGYIKKGLVEVHNLKYRHDQLAEEMKARNYNHKSPMQAFESFELGFIDSIKNLKILRERCIECKRRQDE
jgi:hypothetical protein